MEFDFDPAKDAVNITKHGISLGDAAQFDWDTAVIWPDMRFDYGEARMSALGYIGTRLYSMAFVDRNNIRRIINLRKANPREYRRYAST